ncbi:MAG TPA: DUF1844 domain-containing protein [Candidatus Angelobacter sp.]|jgi:hypothetical protein
MAEKKSEFVVTDKRRFGAEGESRPDAAVEEEKAAAPRATPPPQSAQPIGVPEALGKVATVSEEELPAPPTPEEQHEQSEAYKASTKKIDDMISASGRDASQGPMEMNFERVIESFYMSALIQMGAIRQGNEPPQVDIIGARQTIDSLSVLQEKTKGNLTDREKTLMQNVLFELRMAWIEITNAVASSATNPAAAPPGAVPPGIISPLDQK